MNGDICPRCGSPLRHLGKYNGDGNADIVACKNEGTIWQRTFDTLERTHVFVDVLEILAGIKKENVAS